MYPAHSVSTLSQSKHKCSTYSAWFTKENELSTWSEMGWQFSTTLHVALQLHFKQKYRRLHQMCLFLPFFSQTAPVSCKVITWSESNWRRLAARDCPNTLSSAGRFIGHRHELTLSNKFPLARRGWRRCVFRFSGCCWKTLHQINATTFPYVKSTRMPQSSNWTYTNYIEDVGCYQK